MYTSVIMLEEALVNLKLGYNKNKYTQSHLSRNRKYIFTFICHINRS